MKFLFTYLIFLLASFAAYAQEDSVVVDTAVTIEAVEEDDDEEVYEEKRDSVILPDPAAFTKTPRRLNDADIKRLKNADDFWYVDAVHKRKKNSPRPTWDGSGLRQFFKVLLWIVGIAMVLFIIYRLIESDLFRRNKKPVFVQGEKALEAAHFADADFDPQLESALAANDLRAATRIYFLQLLQALHRKGLIQYGPDVLNGEYRKQWRGHSWAQQFNGLTSIYEYSWFGHFVPTQQQFGQWQQTFTDTIQKLKA